MTRASFDKAKGQYRAYPRRRCARFVEHGELKGAMAEDGGDADAVLARFARAGIDVDALAKQLQRDGSKTSVKSWQELL